MRAVKTDGWLGRLGLGLAVLLAATLLRAQSGGDFEIVRSTLDGGLAVELAVQIDEHLVTVAIRPGFSGLVSETSRALRDEHVDLRTRLIANQLPNTQQCRALRARSALACYKRIDRRSLQ